MFHHMTTNDTPVETFDIDEMSDETYIQTLREMEKALEALERARIKLDVPRRLHKELSNVIEYLIERYEALPNQP